VKTVSDVLPPKGGKASIIKEKEMEDFGLGMFLGAMIGVFISTLIFLGVSEDMESDSKNEQKRFELCLKRDMQWVDQNCIGNK